MNDHPTIEEAKAFFAEIYYGEHHIPSEIKPFGSGWSINHCGSVATHDFNELTRMIFLAHDMCYRLQIQQGGPGGIKIIIWKRSARTGDISYRHPTIEQALAKWRENHKNEEARQDIIEAGEQQTTAQACKPEEPASTR
jgi:hypothetical protein